MRSRPSWQHVAWELTEPKIQGQLGAPQSERILEIGDTACTYDYEVGNDPSTARAIMYGGMDVLTFGFFGN